VIDTHAHLDACEEPARTLLDRAYAAGVERVIGVGSGIASCGATLAIAEADVGVFAALGIHPHQAGGEEADRLEELRSLLRHRKAVAVGETGLDFYRDYAPRGGQERVFEGQLALATELGLPVVVHARAADAAVAAALDGFDGTVILHCFSSPGLLEAALRRGYYVSFAGNLTYPKAGDLREAAVRVPPDRLLVETDSPYLAPQTVRGRPNEPANVVHTAQALAEVRGEDLDVLAARIDANATAAFGLP
jgi:TatD DNase family protein